MSQGNGLFPSLCVCFLWVKAVHSCLITFHNEYGVSVRNKASAQDVKRSSTRETSLRFQGIELLPCVHGCFCFKNVSQSNGDKKKEREEKSDEVHL